MDNRDRIADPWGARTPYAPGQQWPQRVDTYLADGVDPDSVRWVQTASVLHSDGDAFDIAVLDGAMVGVRGRGIDRVNRGRLGPKDLFGWQANAAADRLQRPLVRVGGRLVDSDWDTAMGRIVGRSKELLADRGPSAIGFYTSGQLFLEEYYTLALIAHGAIGTNHLDGNTRLCTATAAAALKESFGCDGQPGSYADVDHADVIALFGHNVAETQTVLWSRMLDRLAGPEPPAIVCVDPRTTPVAERSTVHLRPLPGTNVALMNALLHEIIANDWVDHDYVTAHTVGFAELRARVADYPPEKAAAICEVDAADIRHAAHLLGTARRLLSTVLQGFYQSHQATAAAVQVDNVHLVRGMLGKPGCGVLQMNGQPTAENTRECGADGDLPGFRNWANDSHVADLARVWNLEPEQIPHYGPPTHAMQMMRYAEQGSLAMLWVSATNPAVSLPELARVREILSQDRLFLVVQDIFRTETAELADVVLPAAAWGEKTGTFTNADRTVHLSEQAVPPPGQARSDLDIFLDYARRMDFRDKDGQPIPSWHDPESAFEAWKRCSAGRPCDYTGISYDLLRGGSGIQWPCNESAPAGTERLYADGRFWSDPDYCEEFGKDLVTGAPMEPVEYRAMNPDGKAMIKAAEYLPAHERPSGRFPFALITGRTLYHFHTRTKTGRVRQLRAAAPEPWVEISAADAADLGVTEGDLLEVASARGAIRARARVSRIRPGVLFVPFHYGYWDAENQGRDRAANEITVTDWDPVSKQPLFKTSAAAVRVLAAGLGPAAAPTTTASAPLDRSVPPTRGGADAMADSTTTTRSPR
ncbi:molybdopterin oxidoreductase family protein [Nocardia cyriacigeorgica]|uniref:molybdopterin oxidoreductase family protein n=1 Tax=Nocardia cyriacigeorgica TaxID=135487 RepID=UPI0002ECF413|nr:molybdopterin-dependent oxidoreductase [Nocardia cyriacigeorgica]AVH23544.1 nitrate reductase [Nocardia cyriacigeorgica]MBF6323135.1 molybdopterin-dependent oxidoreductase [Nocardia cyriacigeorgica]MBF6496639.1 molybdopterin-dependent oxidoreductase [Nocardia cyriacigeorgica]PPJ15573.1 nitrate reductase [Nocardia cyriacigeorgica]TLF55791.1 nitrate reductase [Nocardia cyriacigeorgica]